MRKIIFKRNRLTETDQASHQEDYLETELKKAFENNELEIFYQPQVSPDGVILSAEALLRWNHPIEGYISPEVFIPIAKRCNLLNDITDWMIRKICQQIRNWKDRGLQALPISINLSRIRLKAEGLIEHIEEQLIKYRIEPTLLEFELTEKQQLNGTACIIQNLKELGVGIALDNFGTGYSSMAYVKQFPIDKLKIDRSFISNMDVTDNRDTTIISTIISLAKGLGMKVLAEGVEKYEQLQFLKEQDCDYIQGFLFSKAIPAETYEKFLRIGYIMPLIDESLSQDNKKGG